MKHFKLWLNAFILTLCLSPLGLAQANNAQDIYYEIFVRSFQDSNGDGIGDFNGITQRLDYLAELGVSGIWLMPIHPSPSYHGYDVSNYFDVNPDYGSLEDFKTLVKEAHARNIKIIIDLVVNHSSDSHPWFNRAKLNQQPYRDYYLWQDQNPNWKGVSGSPAWHQSETGFYLGLFWSGMPDLNFHNPRVIETINQIAKYWLELGVDGFRVDAIQHIFESSDGNIRNVPETFQWLKTFEAFIKTINQDAFIVAETWTDTQTIAKYHNDANLDMSFNYPLYLAAINAIQSRSATDLAFALNQDERSYPQGALRATFISNHDQVRPATSLGFLKRDEERIKLAASLLLTLPGIPFLYYGEEIGMPNGAEDNDEAKRTPMLWNDNPNAGFSETTPWHNFSSNDLNINVTAQQADPNSILNHYKTLIDLRKNNPALNAGLSQILETNDRTLLALKRQAGEQTLVILANLGNKTLTINLQDYNASQSKDLQSNEQLSNQIDLKKLELRILELP